MIWVLQKASYMHPEVTEEATVLKPVAGSAPAARFRLRGLAIALPCWSALMLAGMLVPDARGQGTHRRLGLPPCSFLVRTGYPCPSCGLTTSMANMAHARPLAAWRANPFGVLVFAWVALLTVAGTVEAVGGRDVVGRLRPGLWWAWAGLGGMLAGWAVKLLTGLVSGELPAR